MRSPPPARWRRTTVTRVVAEVAVARVLATRSTIKTDQRAMVERLTRGGEQLVVVVGEAGTGKTFATVAAAEAWAGAGVCLRVAAPTWRAANVLRSEGLDATSVARLLAELDGGRRPLAHSARSCWSTRPGWSTRRRWRD